jgi:hypothetical protein
MNSTLKMTWRKTLWLAALVLPLTLLWLLPLSAQQTTEKADSTPAAAATPGPEPEAAEPASTDEHVSADNNLTFPVDI